MTAKKSDVWKSVGRRKSSIARVMISSGKGEITINRRNIDTYFGGRDILKVVTKQPFEVLGIDGQYDVDINVKTAGTINGVTFSANIDGEFQFEDGYQISGILGYRLSDSLSLETDISYTQFDYDNVPCIAKIHTPKMRIMVQSQLFDDNLKWHCPYDCNVSFD